MSDASECEIEGHTGARECSVSSNVVCMYHSDLVGCARYGPTFQGRQGLVIQYDLDWTTKRLLGGKLYAMGAIR